MAETERSKRAAIYACTSYYDAQADSIDAQLEIAREYCQANDYKVVAELADHNVSGRLLGAPQLERGLELARRGQFEVFVTRDLVRFARALAKQLMKEYEFLRAIRRDDTGQAGGGGL